MMQNVNNLLGLSLMAIDGELGKVKDFYFDDGTWVIRYLVVDTGHWLPGQKVLIAPDSLGKPDWDNRVLPVKLTREQIRMSPPVEADKPVSRQHEEQLAGYYGWPTYWAAPAIPAVNMMPAHVAPKPGNPPPPNRPRGDIHLRSGKEVTGYDITARDGDIGRVEAMVGAADRWEISYVAVDTGNWFGGRKVLLPVDRVCEISWADRHIRTELTRDAISQGPEYDPSKPVSQPDMERLRRVYSRQTPPASVGDKT